MNEDFLLEKVMSKKEFSQLPRKDVELAFEKFNKPNLNEYQQVKLTRQFLRKIFSSFSSRKLFSWNKLEPEWCLLKHKSTKERYSSYLEIYSRLLGEFSDLSIIDLGAGINGLSYKFLLELNLSVRYAAVEAIGQFVSLMNSFFKENKLSKNAKAHHVSLFDLGKIKRIILLQKKPRVLFLFKVIDSLEIVKRDYSKLFLKELAPLFDKLVLSFPTRSLGSRKKFGVQRGWILSFLKENFVILDDFEINGERYISFKEKVST